MKKTSESTIARNKKAFHDYFIEEHFEAGVALQGWEVKSLRAGRAQLKESYVLLREGEAYLFGCHIAPLSSASTHVQADPTRTRKLLLQRREISRLIGSVERQGYTLIPLALYWKRGFAKLDIGLAKGKKSYDKRATEKERDWQRDKQRLLRSAQKA
ncbi:MAG: SsrA-binding protein SmpB [Candidatus Competibacteraceae bacterium]|jgi:SsrA-binding protein|nr:SsrA-binding protein SmpB [Candidatus Competibacteraceae bacterium]